MDVLATMQAPLKRSSPRLLEKWRSVPPPRPSSLAVPVLSWPSRQSIRHKLHTCQPASLKKVNGIVFDESREIVHGDVVLGLGELFANYKLCWEDHCDEDTPFVSSSYDWLMKFMMLFGFFTLHGPQQAAAMLDLTSSLQSAPYLSDLGDISTGFASAFLLIFFSELGDKTFFIAALLAARNSGLVVFLGTFGALATMTLISVGLGRTFHYVDEALPFRLGEIDLPIDDIAAVCLLVYFGISTLIDASSGEVKAEEEQKEAELAVSELSGNGAGILAAANTIISTFLLVFVAEWGDKSFFSTIALAAASSPLGVIAGALAGHAVATLLAVLGGSLLGTFLSEKIIAYVGGSLFLVFALVTLAEIVN
uniref:GDT1 family protein n=1 Tax=Kalanchoe fedtschenkoi TaxID=63787 RepID=A0A7N0RBJ4_KALFE